MKLFSTLLWFESHRLKGRFWALFFVLAVLVMGLQSCDSLTSSFNYQISSSSSSPAPNPAVGVLGMLQNGEPLFKTLPALGFMGFALILGVAILMTAPFRSAEEWRSGGFQIFFMSDHSFLKLEGIRLLAAMLVSLIFYLLVQGFTGFTLLHKDLMSLADISRINLIVGFWFFTLLGIFFSFGSLISAVSTAYLHKGRSKVLLGLGLLGVIQFIGGLVEGAQYIADPSRRTILLPVKVSLFEGGKLATDVILPVEWVGLAAVLCSFFLVWSSRVYEEVEA